MILASANIPACNLVINFQHPNKSTFKESFILSHFMMIFTWTFYTIMSRSIGNSRITFSFGSPSRRKSVTLGNLFFVFLIVLSTFFTMTSGKKLIECRHCFYNPDPILHPDTRRCDDPEKEYELCGDGFDALGCEARFGSTGELKWMGCWRKSYFKSHNLQRNFLGCLDIDWRKNHQKYSICRCNHKDKCSDEIISDRWECLEDEGCNYDYRDGFVWKCPTEDGTEGCYDYYEDNAASLLTPKGQFIVISVSTSLLIFLL